MKGVAGRNGKRENNVIIFNCHKIRKKNSIWITLIELIWLNKQKLVSVLKSYLYPTWFKKRLKNIRQQCGRNSCYSCECVNSAIV